MGGHLGLAVQFWLSPDYRPLLIDRALRTLW